MVGKRVVTHATKTVLAIATGTAPRKRGRGSYREFAEQKAFAQRCDLHPDVRGLLYTASMTGINLPLRQAAMAKAKGVKRGAPDWMLYAQGMECMGPCASSGGVGCVTATDYMPEPMSAVWWERRVGLALEFKSPDGTGRPSDDQRRWADGLRANGWRVEFPTTQAEAWAILTEYLGLTR